ncbi:hypothetical protein J4E90_002495 [Alternaria incomplexa]|uniref:uncharacterized protein n=1 Tax=Alternaria hordeiaustralica TaxID=1187925 RepID=UPI0020C36DAD|nr:uncharacterized protein J4E84_003752 [Alternaria hordeiaustralica]XP_051293497.1 uncharacterized protein J4E90_002495 [Alternaria incomplexa]XP_051300598.1 uncharacterized protein J4E86_007816 [Alternaria arbusti]KAI4699723.1 hypothetical protein J4E81_004751 [Alternaria sp. BMP 2799]KAI4691458.1 hypothetical protein J4E84_003752 [Alternaria hordeiaustralica]KAI4918115.1 hypothetical protein J4E90_002495 [Alternaria incomplexa]KAI4949861.1 hypothetical protein J4E86_007816 [Alternaria arbu
MVKSLVGALALAALPSALAFRNTSPFFLFSTADLLIPNNDAAIAESSEVTVDILKALEHCPTKSYIIIEQDGVSAADYADGRAMPQLSQYMSGQHSEVKSTVTIPDVVGTVDAGALADHLVSKCGQDGGFFGRTTNPVRPGSQAFRIEQLQRDDTKFDNLIVNSAKSQDYTFIYITTPPTEAQAKESLEHHTYEMETSFPESVQMELKRDLSSHAKRANSTEGGLFEKYQYFTPGIFMGFAAIIPLFLILLVGIRALTSLEVSYFAFSKEMGPNAQKKQ